MSTATPARRRPSGRPPRSRATAVRAVLAFLVVAAALAAAVLIPARLGLDLRGGGSFVIQAQDSEDGVEANAENTDRALEVLRRRIDALGLSEPTLVRSGENRIIIELPGVDDLSEPREVIENTAQLTFHPVLDALDPAAPSPAAPDVPEGGRIVPDEDGQPLVVGPPRLTGDGVSEAAAVLGERGGGWEVTISFQGEGGDQWAELTGDAACQPVGSPQRRVAILLDERVVSSPAVNPEVPCETGIVGGSTRITGAFTFEEARDLAAVITGGALPLPLEVIESRLVGPTLGEEAIDASAKAAVIGIVATGLFIVVVYRLLGFLATVALACYALISYAALVALGATLTLPGLAGFVLAIGLAIDANVLVFERAREEYAAARPAGLRSALGRGFGKAWTAILDSNVTTLLAAGLLFFLASGPVRGFGVTLTIGVLASMVSALLITRALAEIALNRPSVARRPALTGIGSIGRVREWLNRRQPDLIGRRRTWFAVSALLVVLALAGIGVRGLQFGVEFTGGRTVTYSTDAQDLDVDAAREAVAAEGFPRAVVQPRDDGIVVRDAEVADEDIPRIAEALRDALDAPVEFLSAEEIGPSLGDELRRNALIALAVALAAQLLYLAVRFRWTFGLSAIVAMAHDVLIVLGLFAWLGRPIDGVFLAAVLTVIGVSVNDTVVVFDRVRELWRANPARDFAATANAAVLQTVPRTVNTGMGALFILGALAVLGGSSLRDFSLALLIGFVVGLASSSFVAAPLAVSLHRRFPAAPTTEQRDASPYAEREAAGARGGAGSGAVL